MSKKLPLVICFTGTTCTGKTYTMLKLCKKYSNICAITEGSKEVLDILGYNSVKEVLSQKWPQIQMLIYQHQIEKLKEAIELEKYPIIICDAGIFAVYAYMEYRQINNTFKNYLFKYCVNNNLYDKILLFPTYPLPTQDVGTFRDISERMGISQIINNILKYSNRIKHVPYKLELRLPFLEQQLRKYM